MESLKLIDTFEARQKLIWNAVEKPVPHDVGQVAKYARALILLCPLQPGDAAEMIEPPEVTREHSWGWMQWQHLFIAGTLVEIVDVDYDLNGQKAGFCVGFKFHHESSCSSFDKSYRDTPTEERGLFWLAARRFRKVLL